MSDVRPAAVAGMFYPGAPRALKEDVRMHVAAARGDGAGIAAVPKAIIAPHAGYVYSGPIAGSVYARLAAGRDTIRRVVLLGPTHRVPVRGLAVPSARAFATPLGTVEVDGEAVALARTLPQVQESEPAHAFEHSLEVQLPFLQTVLADFRIVPFAVGDARAQEVAAVIELFWGGPETLIVVSSDLSHYHRYAEAREIDRATAEAILARSPELDHEQACGATPINGLLLCVQRHRLQPELVDLRNSGDTAGDRSRVVGYGAFTFIEAPAHG
jgi:AmmeMemoRadiSam system protein B